jgi:hypothetical protein
VEGVDLPAGQENKERKTRREERLKKSGMKRGKSAEEGETGG